MMQPSNNNQDIYKAILKVMQECAPLQISLLHILGHQDKDTKHKLTTIEQLNVDCNWCAKQYVCNTKHSSTSYGNPEIPEAQLHLSISGKIIRRQFLMVLQHETSIPAYHTDLKQKLHWTHSNAETMQWKNIQTAISSFTANDQHCLVIFINDKLPLHSSKAHPHHGSILCPLC